VLGSRAATHSTFGSILAAQALYAVLQYASDNGAAFHGARLAASGRLDPATRGSLVRIRLQLAGLGCVAALALGAAGGRNFLIAVAPFTVALVLFALLPYWEHFGRSESGPWSAYVVLRSVAPALAAAAALLLDRNLPLVAAGAAECAAIAAVAVAFRFRPATDLRLAVSAQRGPWRSVTAIGLPALLWQIGLSSGTIALGAFGVAASAAVLGVAVRLLTGVNQLATAFSNAVFPVLARNEVEPGEQRVDENALYTSLMATVALVATANAVLVAAPEQVLDVLLGHAGRVAEATAILVLGGAAAGSYAVLAGLVMIARGQEHSLLRILGSSTIVVLAGTIVVTASEPASSPVWMAAFVVVGLLLSVAQFAVTAGRDMPHLSGLLGVGAIGAFGFAAVGVAAAASPGARTAIAAVLAVVAASSLAALSLRARAFGHRPFAAPRR
jgi:O-antigen/teichoic acid export membrane protein